MDNKRCAYFREMRTVCTGGKKANSMNMKMSCMRAYFISIIVVPTAQVQNKKIRAVHSKLNGIGIRCAAGVDISFIAYTLVLFFCCSLLLFSFLFILILIVKCLCLHFMLIFFLFRWCASRARVCVYA